MKKFKPGKRLHKPKNYRNPKDLFEFCVNRLYYLQTDPRYPLSLKGEKAYKTTRAWANLIFKNEPSRDVYFGKVTKAYNQYFTKSTYSHWKFRWDFEKIYRDFPGFFKNRDQNSINEADSITQMIEALKDEIQAAKDELFKNTYAIRRLRQKDNNIFEAELDLSEDQNPKLVEDIPITIKIGRLEFPSRVLDFHRSGQKLYFSSDSPLRKYYGEKYVEVDASWITGKLKSRLLAGKEKSMESPVISKFLNGDFTPEEIETTHLREEEYAKYLNESQFKAFQFSNNHDISLIWGPPGTGKSYTLAHILYNFYRKDESTLVTCIANVAVDALARSFVDLLERENIIPEQGEVLRIGYTRDEKLQATDYLFPDNEITWDLRSDIKRIEKKLKNTRSGQHLSLKKRLQDLRNELRIELEKIIHQAKIIFSTSAKVYVDPTLHHREFDNLMVDEASMMSPPHFVALGFNIQKRIVIAGDFRQLGPIVLSRTQLSEKWLYQDIFQFAGVDTSLDHIRHPAVNQLKIQRRFHPKICHLINHRFYENNLTTWEDYRPGTILRGGPYPGKVIAYHRLEEAGQVEQTQNGSRKNEVSAAAVVHLLDEYYQMEEDLSTIGIITPYRAQVQTILHNIEEKNYALEFKNRITVGTIHTFQGSERDLIIFDVVESPDTYIGKLYLQESGRRLVNVAISRTRHQLVIVGSLDAFRTASGYEQVDYAVRSLFRDIQHRHVDRKYQHGESQPMTLKENISKLKS